LHWVMLAGLQAPFAVSDIPLPRLAFSRVGRFRSARLGGLTKGKLGPSQKVQKTSRSVLTVWRGAAYIRLTNEGGAPLATNKFALVGRNPESRVSDTLPGLKRQADRPTTLRLVMSVL
jgi:hypothetical protein